MEIMLNDDDQVLVQILADFYCQHGADDTLGGPTLSVADLAVKTELEVKDIQQKLTRFESYGWVEFCMLTRATDSQYAIPQQQILTVAEEFERSPPPRNLWAELKTWAFSKPWFIVVMLLGVAVPWVVGIIAGLRIIIDWIGVAQSP